MNNFKKVYGTLVLLSLLIFAGCSDPASADETFVASSKSTVFHKPSCTYAQQIPESMKITFHSRSDAVNSGYSPCGVCKP